MVGPFQKICVCVRVWCKYTVWAILQLLRDVELWNQGEQVGLGSLWVVINEERYQKQLFEKH